MVDEGLPAARRHVTRATQGKKGVGNIAREQYRQIFPFENLLEVIGA